MSDSTSNDLHSLFEETAAILKLSPAAKADLHRVAELRRAWELVSRNPSPAKFEHRRLNHETCLLSNEQWRYLAPANGWIGRVVRTLNAPYRRRMAARVGKQLEATAKSRERLLEDNPSLRAELDAHRLVWAIEDWTAERMTARHLMEAPEQFRTLSRVSRVSPSLSPQVSTTQAGRYLDYQLRAAASEAPSL